MDIYLDSFAKSLSDPSNLLSEVQILSLIEKLQSEPLPSLPSNFTIDLFLANIPNLDFVKNPEHSLVFLMLLAEFAEKNALTIPDKQKLELFTQISSKLKVFFII